MVTVTRKYTVEAEYNVDLPVELSINPSNWDSRFQCIDIHEQNLKSYIENMDPVCDQYRYQATDMSSEVDIGTVSSI